MAEGVERRRGGEALPRLKIGEDRRLRHTDSDDEADADQRGTEEERNSPSHALEPLRRSQTRDDREGADRQQHAQRRAELRPASRQPAAFRRWGPFRSGGDGTAPFATDTEALEQPEQRQRHGAPDADHGVGRHETDQDGAGAHQD